MPQVISIKELKNTSEVSEMCHMAQEPIFVTKDGDSDMVLMSVETYESQYNREKIYRELEISERQIQEGKVKTAEESIEKIREKYEL